MSDLPPETDLERAQREFLAARTHQARRKALNRLEALKTRERSAGSACTPPGGS